ncbi:MAG: hypothetical protein QOE41_3157 [Mycobacterium sp.]|jgi:hypothetical protein|nr:hypothetical protein [Mycobacterium sp.]MDT5133846.1 hypothetical protein [Mycobacterium sp.]
MNEMTNRQKIAAVFAGAAVLLGAAGAIAVANPIGSPATHGPVVALANGPDTPGSPDLPEPGDTPDNG